MPKSEKKKELIDKKWISSESIDKIIKHLHLDEKVLSESDKKLTDAIRIAESIINRTLDYLIFNEIVDFNYAVAQAAFKEHFQQVLDNLSKSAEKSYKKEIKEMPETKMKYLRDALHYDKANDIFELSRYINISLEALNIILKEWGVTVDHFGNLQKPQIIPYKANFLSKDDEKYVLMRCTYYTEEDYSVINLKTLSNDIGVKESVIKKFLETKGLKFTKDGKHIRIKPEREASYLLLRLVLDDYIFTEEYSYQKLRVFSHHKDYSRIIEIENVKPEDYDFIKDIIKQCENRFQNRNEKVIGDDS